MQSKKFSLVKRSMQITDGLGFHELHGPQLQAKLTVLPWNAKQNAYRQPPYTDN
jgi:hypothetical protein